MKKIILPIFFLLFLSCQQRNNLDALPYATGEKMENFSLSRSNGLEKWKISGRIARFSPNREGTSITRPKIKIKTKEGKILTLQTGKNGVAEFTINGATKKIDSLTATGKVVIIQKNEKGEALFKSTSKKMVYDGKERVIILTGDPIVQQGKNEFSGKIIRFFIDSGKIVVTGNVKGTVFQK